MQVMVLPMGSGWRPGKPQLFMWVVLTEAETTAEAVRDSVNAVMVTLGAVVGAAKVAEKDSAKAKKEAKEKAIAKAKKAQALFESSLQVKVKLTVAFLQMLGIFGLCFEVTWPPEYEVVIRDVNALVADAELLGVTPPPLPVGTALGDGCHSARSPSG